MKKLLSSFILALSLMINTACSPEDAATAVAVGAGLVYVASIDNNNSHYQNGYYYYRTNSCNRNYEYFDAYGRQYYSSDCYYRNGSYYISFGVALAVGLLIYK
jgi:hypothetical protein